jgi:hypothetical protein
MAYEIEFERRDTYIHVRVTGDNSRETVTQYMEEVQAECTRQDCFRILIEEHLEGPRLATMDIFALISEGSTNVLGVFEAIAYVDEQMGDMGEFAETVAVNRGIPVAVFNSVPNAEAWLVLQKSGSDEQYIFLDKDEANRD